MMTFKEFESELLDKVKEFNETYTAGMDADGELFPNNMPRADWYEQFVMHLENVM